MVVATGNYERTLMRLRKEGKDKSDDEEYKAVLEDYMRRSCVLMCEKYGQEARRCTVELKGILMLSQVLPAVLLEEVHSEVEAACKKEGVAIAQSHSQVFMYEVPGDVTGEVGLEVGVGGERSCKLLNIFLREGLGGLWPRHKYCKVLLLQTDGVPVDEWKDCTYHLDYSGKALDKICEAMPSLRPVFVIIPLEECGANLDIGYRGRRLPRKSRRIRTRLIKRGSAIVVSSFQWHRTGRPNTVEEIGKGIRKGLKKLKQQSLVCSSDLRLHICIGPEIEYIDIEEATVTGEAEKQL
jgi:hypothetical protein